MGIRSPIIEFRRELLPEPTSPIMQTNSPFFIFKSISFRTTRDSIETVYLTSSSSSFSAFLENHFFFGFCSSDFFSSFLSSSLSSFSSCFSPQVKDEFLIWIENLDILPSSGCYFKKLSTVSSCSSKNTWIRFMEVVSSRSELMIHGSASRGPLI